MESGHSKSKPLMYKVLNEFEQAIVDDKIDPDVKSDVSPEAFSINSSNLDPLQTSTRYSQTLEDKLLRKLPKNLILDNTESFFSIDSPVAPFDLELQSTDEFGNSESQSSLFRLQLGYRNKKSEAETNENKEKKESVDPKLKNFKYTKNKILHETTHPSFQEEDVKAEEEDDFEEKKIHFEDVNEDVPTKYKGMKFEYGEVPKPCKQFMNVEEYSEFFVDDLIDEALYEGKNLKQLSNLQIIEGIEYIEEYSLSSRSTNPYICLLEWPTIEDFNINLGIAKLEEFLSYWKFEEDWKHCTNFLGGESDPACDFYHYEVIFSIPCKQYPIPQVTASVYFTFEVSRVKPKRCLVDLYYWFEGQREKHKPGIFTFQEQRLFHIVDAKIKFYKTLTF